MSVECFGIGEIGTSFQAKLHAGKQLHGRLKYEDGQEIKVDLNADKQVTDVFNVR